MQIIQIDKSLMIALRENIFANAKRLLFDAEILYKKHSFPSSVFLAISSIEEIGKLYLMLIAHLENKKGGLDSKKYFGRRGLFTNHDKKHLNSFIVAVSKTSQGKKITKNISKLWELVADGKLMTIRNNSLYLDVDLKKNVLIIPQSELNKKDAYFFIETAYEVLLSQIDSAYGHFWIDDSREIRINKMEQESHFLSDRLKKFKEDR